jgi:hypothetical protein
MKADWPCSSLEFSVNVSTPLSHLSFEWEGVRTRIKATISTLGNVNKTAVSTLVVKGDTGAPKQTSLAFPAPGLYAVTIRKLTTAAPLGMGAGGSLLAPSVLYFYGVSSEDAGLVVTSTSSTPVYSRKIEFVGASDTAGYCVDGTPNTTPTEADLFGWEYENCDGASPAYIGRFLQGMPPIIVQV